MSGELSRPIIVTPLYVGGRAVTISGHIAEADVKIYRYDEHGNLDPTPIGDRQAPYARYCNVRVTELGLRDHIFAKQTLGSEDSDNASFTQAEEVLGLPVEILDEAGLLPAPYVYSPIYACGKAVKVYNIVNGALVDVYRREVGARNSWDHVASAPIGCSRAKFNFRDQVELETEYVAIQRFPDIDSRESNIVPVVEYEGELPPPTILGRSKEGQVFLPECAPSFQVAGTETGATLNVYRVGDSNPIATVEGVEGGVTNVEVEYPPGLVGGWELFAVQELCGPDRSQESERAIVMGIEDYLDEFSPVLVRSLGPGGDILTVQGAHESTIRIIGDGGDVIGIATCFGVTEVQLDEHVGELDHDDVQPTQSFVCDGEEITGEGEVVPVDELLASEPLDGEEITQLLDAHNDCREAFRQEVGLTPAQCPNLRWSDELAHWAQLYATQLAVYDPAPNVSHSDRYTQRGDPHDGENIAWSVSTIAGMVTVIKEDWCEGEGGRYFDDGQPPIEEVEEGEERNWKVWGHYTQVVWSNTTEVGCGRARLGRGTRYWVCQYRVGGNMRGQWPHGQDPSTL